MYREAYVFDQVTLEDMFKMKLRLNGGFQKYHGNFNSHPGS